MVAKAFAGKHRPVNTTEDIWCPFCVVRKRLYICDMHHWGSAPYFENRLPKLKAKPIAEAKAKKA